MRPRGLESGIEPVNSWPELALRVSTPQNQMSVLERPCFYAGTKMSIFVDGPSTQARARPLLEREKMLILGQPSLDRSPLPRVA